MQVELNEQEIRDIESSMLTKLEALRQLRGVQESCTYKLIDDKMERLRDLQHKLYQLT